MPIIDIQRRLAEAGRIRIGEQVPASNGKTRPNRLETFRITSPNKKALEALAEVYGGAIVPWADAPVGTQWELYTESAEINVLVPPEEMSFSQFYEQWSGGGCKVRCDGQFDSVSNRPCHCDPDGRDCKPHTRLSVMIAEVVTSGMWRLDTQGYYAAVELGGAFELASIIGSQLRARLLRGTLRLEQREVKRPDEPAKRFVVPVLNWDESVLAGPTSLEAAPSTLIPIEGGPQSLADAIREIEAPTKPSTRANAAAPIPSTGLSPRGAQADFDDEDDDAGSDELERQAIVDEVGRLFATLPTSARSAFRAFLEGEGLPLQPTESTLEQITRVRSWLISTLASADEGAGEKKPAAASVTKGADAITTPKASQSAMAKIRILAEELGYGDEMAHVRVGEIVGREVTSYKTLTRAEASLVLDTFAEEKKASA